MNKCLNTEDEKPSPNTLYQHSILKKTEYNFPSLTVTMQPRKDTNSALVSRKEGKTVALPWRKLPSTALAL